SVGPARAARAASACGRRGGGALVVPVHARLPGRAPDRRCARHGRREGLRGAARLARRLDRGVSRHLDPGGAAVRSGGGMKIRILAALWRLNLWRLADVVLGLALAGYALHRLGRVPSLAQLAAFVLALASAAVVVYALWVVLMSLAFWFVSVENLSVLFDAVYEGARYPVSAYPEALRFLFVYLIPIAWTTTIPASTLTGRLRPEIGLVAALVAGAALALARLVWRTALKRYTGASG